MKAQILYNGNNIVKVVNCLCSDGKRRVATITGKPYNQFFTPARVRVKGRSVSGFIAAYSWRDDAEFYQFFHRKNGYALSQEAS